MRKPLTGEPCAGEPHARFGGRGGSFSLSDPYLGNPIVNTDGLPYMHDQRQISCILPLSRYAHDRALIVGHSSTVPKWLNAFGYPKKIKLTPLEYNNLFMIIPKSGGEPLVFQMRY
jgi:hypothetical protein